MKKISIIIMSTVLALFGTMGLTSCTYEEGTPQVEYGFDLDGNGNLSFDNFDILYSLAVCEQTKACLIKRGFVESSKAYLLYPTTLCTLYETKKMVQAACDEANTAQLATEAQVGYDFVVRCRINPDAAWTEVFRGK